MNNSFPLRKIASPYSLTETWGVVKRNICGIDKKRNHGIVTWTPPAFSIYPLKERLFTVTFIGDIMSIGSRRVVIDEAVKDFVSESRYLIGNFEATITRRKRRKGVLYGALERQSHDILELLSQLFSPEATFLSVANNHAGDFAEEEFRQSIALLKGQGYHLFGLASCPVADVGEALRIVAATAWSNQRTDRVHWLKPERLSSLTGKGRLNILYPHWGYELELFPRPEQLRQIGEHFSGYDAVIGHHSHTVQPVTADQAEGERRLIAYSLGDFCSCIAMQAYRYGIVMNLEIGYSDEGRLVTGSVCWSFVESVHLSSRETRISLVKKPPYLT